MRYVIPIWLATLVSFAATLFASSPAIANMCWGASLYDAYQDGDGVELRFSLFADGAPGIEDAFTLKRNGMKLFADKVFSPDDADSSGSECWWWNVDEAYCADNEAECTDCDGDGEPECLGSCSTAYHFTQEDSCVSPGHVRYDLDPCGGWEELVIEDVGQDCDSYGCTVSKPGRSSPEALVAGLMLGIGLIAAGFARRPWK